MSETNNTMTPDDTSQLESKMSGAAKKRKMNLHSSAGGGVGGASSSGNKHDTQKSKTGNNISPMVMSETTAPHDDRKKKSMDCMSVKSAKLHTGLLYLPRPPEIPCTLSEPNWGDHPSPEALELIQTAIATFNEYSKPSREYEFAGGVHINAFIQDGIWYHCNFKVKLKDDSTSEKLVVFAELKRPTGQKEYTVTNCYILSPEQHVRRPLLHGCKACDHAPHRQAMVHRFQSFNPGFSHGVWY